MTPGVAAWLRPGDLVLDIGAHTGETTVQLATAVGVTGIVLAVEPHPGSMAALVARCRPLRQVVPIESAIGAGVGRDLLYVDAEDERRCSLWAANVLKPTIESWSVPVTTVDVLVGPVPPGRQPRLIHADIQGSELAMLCGAARTLDLYPGWYVEVWAEGLRHAGATVDDLCRPFRSRGYTLADGEDWTHMIDRANRHSGHSAIDVLILPPGQET